MLCSICFSLHILCPSVSRGRKYKWYQCTNGHAYAINKCGQPMERGTCHCGAVIGGENHQFAANNAPELTGGPNMGFDEKVLPRVLY